MTDKVQKIKDWISCQQDSLIDANGNFQHSEDEAAYYTLCNLDAYIDSLQEDPVSEDLEEACEQLAENARKHKAVTSSPFFCQTDYRQGVMDGAKWQKEILWKPADSNDLPEIDKDVIVLTQPYPLDGTEYVVSFAHRPYKEKYIYKNLTTGNIETFENETYDEGGWNIPDVKWWLDYNMDSILKRNDENNKNDKR